MEGIGFRVEAEGLAFGKCEDISVIVAGSSRFVEKRSRDWDKNWKVIVIVYSSSSQSVVCRPLGIPMTSSREFMRSKLLS